MDVAARENCANATSYENSTLNTFARSENDYYADDFFCTFFFLCTFGSLICCSYFFFHTDMSLQVFAHTKQPTAADSSFPNDPLLQRINDC